MTHATLALLAMLSLSIQSVRAEQAQQPPQASDGLDAASVEALQKTQALLKDAKQRDTVIKQDSFASKADAKAKEAAGSAENTEALYGVSADILETITKEAKGDPSKMNELVQKAMADPQAFYEKLTPEQKARIKSIAEKSPAGQAQKTKP